MKSYYINCVAVLVIIAVVSVLLILNPPQEEQKEDPATALIMTVIQAETELVKHTEVKATEPVETVRYYDVPLDKDIQDYIIAKSTEHNINPALIFAIIERESNYDCEAVGDGGNSIGLMQINTYWQQDRIERMGIKDLTDPFQNVEIGIDILSELISRYEDISLMLMAYNGGPGYADSMTAAGIYSTEYSEYVIKRMMKFDCDVTS
ncbi:MAG: transglycosylase SLT domain-containing protein [Lachnospiraceae bacterium]|nr:transglycosylase SLT domain-containing protein [Lachnospiraceae bacterium]